MVCRSPPTRRPPQSIRHRRRTVRTGVRDAACRAWAHGSTTLEWERRPSSSSGEAGPNCRLVERSDRRQSPPLRLLVVPDTRRTAIWSTATTRPAAVCVRGRGTVTTASRLPTAPRPLACRHCRPSTRSTSTLCTPTPPIFSTRSLYSRTSFNSSSPNSEELLPVTQLRPCRRPRLLSARHRTPAAWTAGRERATCRWSGW